MTGTAFRRPTTPSVGDLTGTVDAESNLTTFVGWPGLERSEAPERVALGASVTRRALDRQTGVECLS